MRRHTYKVDIYDEILKINNKMILNKLTKQSKLEAAKEIKKILFRFRDNLGWYEIEISESILRCMIESLD